MAQVEAQCDSCKGTGIYHGMCEPKGVGVVCLNCDGTGKAIIKYTPFDGRKTRTGILHVQRSRGAFLPTGTGPTGNSISYNEFLAGKMPK